MNLSFGEYRALVAKAMRGAGYSWGLTEDGAFAAKRLAEFGLPSASMIVQLLRSVDGQEVASLTPDSNGVSDSGLVCGISLGVSLADAGGCEGLDVDGVIQPLLVSPSLARVCGPFEHYVIEWDGGRVCLSSEFIAATGYLPTGPTGVHIAPSSQTIESQELVSRVVLDAQTARELERFAHRVYAPATEASRNAGAGADTNDDD